MPTRVLSVGTADTKILANSARTVLIIQNLDATSTNYVYVADSQDVGSISGVRLAGTGGSLTLNRSKGEEPEKEWFISATTAGTPVRVMELYGSVAVPDFPPYPPYPTPPTPAPTPAPEKYFW